MFVRRSNERPGEIPGEAPTGHEERRPEATSPAAVAGAKLYQKVKSPTKSIIDAGVGIAGTVACTGELEVLGQIQGDLHSSALIVGHTGHIHGDVFADHAHIDGRVDGNIRGKQIILGSNAHVTGDIHHASLVIEHGAIFEGKVRRSANPAELQPPAATQQPAHQQSAPQPIGSPQQPAAQPQHAPAPQPAAQPGNGTAAAPDGTTDIGRWPRQVLASQ